MYAELKEFAGEDPVKSYQRRGTGTRLVAITSVLKGRVVSIHHNRRFVIGAGEDADYIITGASMASSHAALNKKDDHWIISTIDKDALLWVNGEPLEYAVLHDKDRIKLGRHSFIFFEQ